MRAMILAAGLGTRLRPLTDDRPKALVEINGRTLLEIALTRLRGFGINEVIVNVHHFADKLIDYLAAHGDFGMRIEISREEELLDTGGGILKAAPFFLQAGRDEFVVHNVDVLSSIDLGQMLQFHRERQAMATLAVQQRNSSRRLLFDDRAQLCGRQTGSNTPELSQPASHTEALAFCGIHIISRRIFAQMTERGVFPIVPVYLRLSAQGERVIGFRADDYYWRDLGTQESLQLASRDLQQKILL